MGAGQGEGSIILLGLLEQNFRNTEVRDMRVPASCSLKMGPQLRGETEDIAQLIDTCLVGMMHWFQSPAS